MKRTNKYLLAVLAIALFFGWVSCGGDKEDPILNPDPETEVKPEEPTSMEYAAKYLSRIEVPKLKSGNLFIQHSTLYNNDSVMTYCLEYDTTVYHSRWVAFRFDATTTEKNTKRPDKDPFADDPDPSMKNYRIGNDVFGKSYVDLNGNTISQIFDRGHICASNDRVYSVEANAQTFYMSNMSPQMHDFNGIFWAAFENHVVDLVRDKSYKFTSFADTLYVVKGGTIEDVNINKQKEKGIMGTVKRPNGKKVVVPKYYYMALLAVKNGEYNALGFWMEHKEYKDYTNSNQVTKSVMKPYIVTIDELESYTGIDFFHNLPDNIENEVESTCDTAFWKF